MRTSLLVFSLITLIGFCAHAQLNQGGLPLSIRANIETRYTPSTSYPLPDWDKGLKRWEEGEAKGINKPYLMALMTATDISFPSSGITTTLENGQKIWRAQVSIEHAKGVSLLYDKFQLPEGVKYFITNGNNMQTLGAYTQQNNDISQQFAHEAIQGGIINLEIDMDANVDLRDIKFHINRAAVYFRGVDYLLGYATTEGFNHVWDARDTMLTGGTSICTVNAICPVANNYAPQRNASLQLLVFDAQGGGACSATMLNTATNTLQSCKQYCLTASHCDMGNHTNDAAFAQYLFRFDFQQATCNPSAGAIPNTTKTIVGARFAARALFPNNNEMHGDFLLLQCKEPIPASWNVTLAGWNNDPNLPTTEIQPAKFIGFHHPEGDAKKVSSFSSILSSTGNIGPAEIFWKASADTGYAGNGSSGSGLFDGNGQLIGSLTLGDPTEQVDSACKINGKGLALQGDIGKTVFYNKFSLNWDYTGDGNIARNKLKTWLDPQSTGLVTLSPLTACNADTTSLSITGVKTPNDQLESSVSIYPNPTTTGIATARVNFAEPVDLNVEIYNIAGVRLAAYNLKKVLNDTYKFDLSAFANGMYMIRFSDGINFTSKKIMVQK